jgi:aspartate aminotransferase
VFLAVLNPGDEVIIPSPYWVSYTSQVEMVDAHPVLLPTKMGNDFKISAEQLDEAIESLSNPKALILNSPNNPTGSVYSQAELKAIAEVCLKHDILIISDEIYEKLTYDNHQHISIASLSDEVKENTVVINGVSKAYAMTGWRLGYAAGPSDIIKSASRIQSHTTSCVNSLTQKAAIVAMNDCESSVDEMRKTFQKRRNILVDGLNSIPNVHCTMPKGAFYAMPDISYYLQNNQNNIKNSGQLCEYLLTKYHIAVVPGSAFGADNFIRFSYANSMDNIQQGLERLQRGLESLVKNL